MKTKTIIVLLLLLSSSSWSMSWSPNGDAVLVNERGRNIIRYVDGDRPDVMVSHGGCAQWSPQGDAISLGHRGEISLLNVDGSGQRTIYIHEGEGSTSNCARWSPDGDRLAFVFYQTNTKDHWLLATIYSINREGEDLRVEGEIADEMQVSLRKWVREGIIYSYFRGLMNTYQTYYYLLSPQGSSISIRSDGDYARGKIAFSTTSLSAGIWVPLPDPGIYTFGLRSGRELEKLSDYYPCGPPSWDPSGRALVLTCLGRLLLLDTQVVDRAVSGDAADTYWIGNECFYQGPKWSPRGDKIAVWYTLPGKDPKLQFLDVKLKTYGADVTTPVRSLSWGQVKREIIERSTID